ncbi:MAG: sigma-70 family RNA polymerase sigma factor [Anaerolineales bacterium]
MGNPKDDIELIKRVAKGDEQALLRLYDRYASRVYALALYILKDRMMAEEAVQDAFFRVWNHARDYLPQRGPFLIWLLTLTRHIAIDRLRLEARRPLLSDASDPEEHWRSLPAPNTADEEARWRTLYLTVQNLSPEHRQVIELAYYQGLSQSQIAEVLGWPLGTVKTRLREAMRQLRRAWGVDQSESPPNGV